MQRLKRVSVLVLAILAGTSIGSILHATSGRSALGPPPLADSKDHWKLVALTHEMARLRSRSEHDDRPDLPAPERQGDDDLEYTELLARERETAARRAAALEAAASDQPVDPDWAPIVELQLADRLAAHGPPGTTLRSAVCKTTLCIAELEHPPGDDGTQHMSWLRIFGLSRGFFVHHQPTPSHGARTVAYLARNGATLPRTDSATAAGSE